MQAAPANSGRGVANNPFSARGLGDVPLFHAAWLFALGIAFTEALPLRSSIVLLALIAAGFVCVLATLCTPRLVWLPVATVWCLLGVWCALIEPQPIADPGLAAISDGLVRTGEGTIVAAGPIRSDADLENPDTLLSERPSQSIDVRVSSVELISDRADYQAPMAGEVRLTIRWPAQASTASMPDGNAQSFRCGEHVRAVARLVEPETYHDPGVWSREQFLIKQEITATAYVNSDRIERVSSLVSGSWACRLAGWQHAASAKLLALPLKMHALPVGLRLSNADAAMFAAMVTGDRAYLTHSIRVGFERTGSFHMLVVSGFHLAIVTGCVFWVARALHLPRVPALITLAVSFAYALFTGFATPVQRSLWMVTLYLAGRLLFRDRSPLNTIGFAALCLLAASPASLFDASLQMTLLAVLAIGGVAAPLLGQTIHPYFRATRAIARTQTDVSLPPRHAQFRVTIRIFMAAFGSTRWERVAARAIPPSVRFFLRCMELLVVSCVVEMAMALPMALYFHRITVFVLPVNIFLVPLLLFLMPAALITLLTAVLWPAAAAVPAVFVAVPLHFGMWLVNLFGTQSLGDLRIPAPVIGRSLLFCALLAAAMLLARSSRWPRRAA